MKLLIGYDRSPACEKAIADLSEAGLPEKGEAWVVSVQDFYTPPPLPAEMLAGADAISPYFSDIEASRAAVQQELEARAAEGAAKVRAVLPSWTVTAEGLLEAPSWGLIARAEELLPDLVVVGAPHGSRLEQVFFGSVCATVAAKCPVSVRVGRGRTTPRTHPLRILAAVDGSAYSDAAVSALAGRRWPGNAEIRLLHVVESDWPAFTPESEKIFEEVGRRMLQRYAAQLAPLNHPVDQAVRYGKPRKIVLEEAAAWDTDVLFVGAKGMSGVERLLLGSVSSAVASRATCSVEIVRS